KGETVAEITGFARAMRDAAEPLRHPFDDAIDTCGTGGDGRSTFNVSTVSAFVAAGAGCRVAKHGNRSVSSRCGSAEALEALGIDPRASARLTARLLAEVGVGFLFAPDYHRAMRHAVEPRREIGLRTIFNIVGPLTNPAGVRRQLVGVFERELTEVVAKVLARLGSTHCVVVHGADGLDEITLGGPTHVCEWRDGTLDRYRLDPRRFGFARVAAGRLRGGSPRENARIALAVLEGRPGPARDVALINAGAAIYVGGVAESIETGIERARESIDSGAAVEKLHALRRFAGLRVA
ncbi:MAG TPA: anthranilate phosphoribosyltransferase, partial [Candidatus Polarisedimenticolaceae bacterium]|nr:anthranilate phosphoribosyltransferase [Candidatus Polarisedimenticolaceae bacterium]